MADKKFIKAKLIERRETSKDLGVFIFEPEEEVTWESGQYCTLGLMGDKGKLIQRPYSIVSASFEKNIELFAELVPKEEGGNLTPLIWELKVGDEVDMRPKIRGKFVVDTKSGRKTHFLVGTVTGAAPFVSMVRDHKHHFDERMEKGYRFFILQGASRGWELTYEEELRKLDEECDWFTYVPTISRPWEDSDWKGETGRADDIVRKYFDSLGADPSNVTAYLCGHPGMIESSEGILKRARISEEQILKEVYF